MILLVSAMILFMVSVGTAHAYYDETGIIDSQLAIGSAGSQYGSIQFSENCTSWLKVHIAHGVYEWEWITMTPPDGNPPISVSVISEAVFTVAFPASSAITIRSHGLTLVSGTGSWSPLMGGNGNNNLQIEIVGNSSWAFTLTTNDIPQSDWGSIIPISISLVAGGNAYPIIVNLQV